ncbi:L-dopachrome tautomerase yellow-f2-like [Phlebotomus papatasi]|uniref:L-dopachrome tautomerase yellow-f2-like n=1 Tax=Phlebotomus papatasi TaxID=29031 RepID=UPI0024844F77|nr:L-dopachrome tautomerase yellow-f2-like [Phlebotomus papatasi]
MQKTAPAVSYSNAGGYNYYNSSNIIVTAFSHDYKTGCMFFALPRRSPGVPATVAFFNSRDFNRNDSPHLRAFPTYEDNYVPGWFGVNDLRKDDYKYDIYPDSRIVKRNVDFDSKDEETYDLGVKIPQYGVEYYRPSFDDYTPDFSYGDYNPSLNYTFDTETEDEDDDTRTNMRKPSYGTEYYKPPSGHFKPSYQHVSQIVRPIYVPTRPIIISTTTESTTSTTKRTRPTTTTATTKRTWPTTTTKRPRPTTPPTTKPTTQSPRRSSYHFISVYNSNFIDHCSRLFFLDMGFIEYIEGNIFIRRPALWAFDVDGCDERSFDQLPVLKVTLPDYVVNDASGLYDMVVDVYGTCNEFAVYIASTKDNRLIVFDSVKRSFWYFKHETFKPGAERPYLLDFIPPPDPFNFGLLGLALGSTTKYTYRNVFYAPGSSLGLFKTSTEVLRDKFKAPGNPTSSDFSYIGYRGQESQLNMVYDEKNKVLFFIHLLTNSVKCWNTNTHLKEGNVVTLFTGLQYGMYIDIDGERNLWFLMLNADILLGGNNPILSNVFYGLYRVSVDDIIRGTACNYKG